MEEDVYEKLENVTNELLELTREIEFSIMLFGKKTTAANALKIRNMLREYADKSEIFKTESISVFKK